MSNPSQQSNTDHIDLSTGYEVAVPNLSIDDELLQFPLGISQLANAAQTTVHTVRNYLLEGLLHSHEQTSGGHGLYDQCALKRLRLIRSARAAGLLILDIKPLFFAINEGNEPACGDAIKALHSKIHERQTFLRNLSTQLSHVDQLTESH